MNIKQRPPPKFKILPLQKVGLSIMISAFFLFIAGMTYIKILSITSLFNSLISPLSFLTILQIILGPSVLASIAISIIFVGFYLTERRQR